MHSTAIWPLIDFKSVLRVLSCNKAQLLGALNLLSSPLQVRAMIVVVPNEPAYLKVPSS